MSQTCEIRDSPGEGTFRILRALLMFVVAGMLGLLVLTGVDLHGRGRALLVVAGALVALAFGIHDLRRAFDRRIQVVLDGTGFRDRRAGNVLVPWIDVREARLVSVHHSGAARKFEVILFRLDGAVPAGIRYSSGASAMAMAMPWADEATVR